MFYIHQSLQLIVIRAFYVLVLVVALSHLLILKDPYSVFRAHDFVTD